MTTDTVAKQARRQRRRLVGRRDGQGRGDAGPGLATMLVVITTDAVVDPAACRDQLAEACRVSFDRVDSDGCMSTNDTVSAAEQRRVRSVARSRPTSRPR